MTNAVITATDDERRQLLRDAKTIAVVGWSTKPDRPSHEVAEYLHESGYDVIAVNPLWAGQEAYGRPVYATLSEIPVPVDIVDVFRRAEDCLPVAEEAVKIGAKALWLQLGIVNDDAMRVALEGGLIAIQNRCTAIEYRAISG